MTTASAKRSVTLSDASRRHNPWAADIYDRARARGASHTHATRFLGRAWSQVIWRLWHDHDTYDPNRHTALQRLIAAADNRRSTRTDSPSPSDGSAPPSPQAARRAERAALDGKPTGATKPHG